MNKTITTQEKIKQLIDYYKDKGLLIVGLNDSQGVNISSTFFRKGLLDFLADTLTSDELTPEVINAFSLLMNKTEHIDFFLRSDLSIEEIKRSQVYSAVSALEKVMTDLNLPKFIGKVGYVYKTVYKIQKDDNKKHIATSLKEVCEPTVIYSSGVNNLMREVGNNPFAIKSDYKNREKRPNYYYTLEKAKNPKTLENVMDSIKMNFENLLAINEKTDIYALGAYVPASLRIEEMNVFKELILKYNEYLEKLCDEYNVTFVDTDLVGNKFNKSEANFHISTKGHNVLANHIICCMYERKILLPSDSINVLDRSFVISGDGSWDMFSLINNMYTLAIEKIYWSYGYDRVRALKIKDEREREKEVFEKVLSKINKNSRI